jgi:hypothetical protein
MANTQSMCTSFMQQLMVGEHQLGTATLVSRTSLTAPTTDTLKAALYLASATINASTTAYTATGEVTGTNYTAGGITVTNATAPSSTNTSSTAGVAYWTPSASLTYTTVTLSTAFDCMLLYNSTQSNKAISVHTFGAQTITAGTFTLTMPANTTAAALLRLSTT